jgi:hypothetical protein
VDRERRRLDRADDEWRRATGRAGQQRDERERDEMSDDREPNSAL